MPGACDPERFVVLIFGHGPLPPPKSARWRVSGVRRSKTPSRHTPHARPRPALRQRDICRYRRAETTRHGPARNRRFGARFGPIISKDGIYLPRLWVVGETRVSGIGWRSARSRASRGVLEVGKTGAHGRPTSGPPPPTFCQCPAMSGMSGDHAPCVAAPQSASASSSPSGAHACRP